MHPTQKWQTLMRLGGMALLGLFLIAVVITNKFWGPPTSSPTNQASPQVLPINQPPEYFREKWGTPQAVNKAGDEITWIQGNLKAVVSFRANQAETIRYALPLSWTDQQIAAALGANGSDWKLVPYNQMSGTLTPVALHAMGFGGLAAMRWLSAEGNDASLINCVMTIRSKTLISEEAQKQAEEDQRQKAVPQF